MNLIVNILDLFPFIFKHKAYRTKTVKFPFFEFKNGKWFKNFHGFALKNNNGKRFCIGYDPLRIFFDKKQNVFKDTIPALQNMC